MFESSNLNDLIIYLWPDLRQLTLKNKFKSFLFIKNHVYICIYFIFKKTTLF
jgi:hypothetical protein